MGSLHKSGIGRSPADFDVYQMYLEEIKAVESCNAAENERLVRLVRGGDAEAERRLIEGNLKLALGMTRGFLNRGIQAGDLAQEANIALVTAVREFGQGAVGESCGRFEDYLETRVKEALLAAVEEQESERRVEEKLLAHVKVLLEISKDMAEQLGREPTVAEMAKRMKLTEEEIKDIMKLTLDALSVTGE